MGDSKVSESAEKGNSKFQNFLKKQGIKVSWKTYFIDALGAMALGLFASLLIGTIINTAATLIGTNQPGAQFLDEVGTFAAKASGAAMAVAIASALNAPPLVLYSVIAVGIAANQLGGAGGPLAVFFIAIIAVELGKLVYKLTAVDIIVIPAVTVISGVGAATVIAPAIGDFANLAGTAIIWATEQQPFLMGIVVSVLMGMILTLPISSAAVAAALGITGLAGGAAFAGCCAQMVGFAVMSFKENGWGGLVSQGIGTSMLQMPNIVKNPWIWLPPTLASAITGPLATTVFNLEMNGAPISSGMGTSGLVGQIGMITGWFNPSELAIQHGANAMNPVFMDWFGMILIAFILPAILTLAIAYPLRKKGIIKSEHLKIKIS